MSLRLVARQPPALPVDASSLAPGALAALPLADIERLRLPHGRDTIAVAELFEVHRADGATRDTLVLDGDLSRFHSIGAGLASGAIEVHGPVGDSAGLGMSAGRLVIHGRARDLTGCAMRGGWLEVMGDIGDFGACARPGDMNGMRGGTLLVRGAAGARLGDRMRRGTVLVWGDCGDFVASRMVAGTLVLGGRCGAHAGWGMRRGTLLFAGVAPPPPPTFVPVHSGAEVFWQLLSRELSRYGAPLADLPRRRVQRHAGDLAVGGTGEWLVLR